MNGEKRERFSPKESSGTAGIEQMRRDVMHAIEEYIWDDPRVKVEFCPQAEGGWKIIFTDGTNTTECAVKELDGNALPSAKRALDELREKRAGRA